MDSKQDEVLIADQLPPSCANVVGFFAVLNQGSVHTGVRLKRAPVQCDRETRNGFLISLR